MEIAGCESLMRALEIPVINDSLLCSKTVGPEDKLCLTQLYLTLYCFVRSQLMMAVATLSKPISGHTQAHCPSIPDGSLDLPLACSDELQFQTA